ncbi:MAG: DAK2 domain-containing protein [Bacilli bacterium]|jgi:DAK2 domain fusion protein YloV|nr:DAK2 domain-containing protein [Bacilli bacterium]
MATLKVNGELYKQLIIYGAANLRANYKVIDALNVFPVPDGDTGTNMRMTIEAGAAAIKDATDESIYEMSKKVSRGMLMGARGNSGVILSQFFRGVYKGLKDIKEASIKEFAKAFQSGVNQAYHAVLKPVEGTILTVAREASEKAFKTVKKNDTLERFFEIYLKEANESLQRTPELLQQLKDAGVVDSGGAGFICVIEGMQKYLLGEEIQEAEVVTEQATVDRGSFNAHSKLEFGYCTEFILQLQHAKVNIPKFDIKVISDYLESIGNSIVAIQDEDIVKVHVHTMTPGKVFEYCQQFGEFITLKIENMQVQHNEGAVLEAAEPIQCDCPECVEMRRSEERKKFAVVAVASGDGLVNCFKEMGVDYVVSGGQSMNPSAEDFVKGFDLLNAENIIVFPNNSNIVLTAQQAGKYYEQANIIVVPSKTLAQGYSALTMLDLSSGDADQIVEEIKEVIANVTTGLITYSIRDTEFEDVSIKKGDYIGICNGKIVTANVSRLESVKKLLEFSDIAEKEIVTIITGKDATAEEIADIKAFINETYSHVEIDEITGEQDIYSYIFSIE